MVPRSSPATRQNGHACAVEAYAHTAGPSRNDGAANFDDLLVLAQNYGATSGKWWATGDFDFNGAVDFDDLLNLAQHYGSGAIMTDSFQTDWTLAQSLVPEPTTLSAICSFAVIARRRRPKHI